MKRLLRYIQSTMRFHGIIVAFPALLHSLRPSSVRSCRLIIESEEVHRSDFFKARSVDFYPLRPQTRPTSVLLVLSATRRSHQRHHPATTRRCVALTRLRVDLTLLRVYSTRRRVDLLHRPVASPACSSTTLFRRCWSFLFLVVFSVYFRSFCCVLLLCLCCLGYRLQVLTVFDLLLETFVTEFLLLVLSFGCFVPTLLSGARCATAALTLVGTCSGNIAFSGDLPWNFFQDIGPCQFIDTFPFIFCLSTLSRLGWGLLLGCPTH